MAAAGLRQNVMTLKWDPAAPMTIPDQAFLDGAVPVAHAAGIKVVFALYGAKPTTFTGDGGNAEAFAAWAGQVARTYPSVKTFIVGNEPNQPRFWRPQFDASGRQASAAAFGPVLAATYDALKAVDGSNQVAGVGLSPRGNDRPDAPSNVSTSPVRFLQALGSWYRASGRTLPLMDALSFHPYPNANTDQLSNGYAWPSIGLVNADRLKQAIQDAFGGTSQPTVSSRPEARLRRARLAGRHERAGRVRRLGERPGHDRGEPGRDLRPDSAAGRVRPGDLRREPVRLRRRGRPRRLPGRARPQGRHAAARR